MNYTVNTNPTQVVICKMPDSAVAFLKRELVRQTKIADRAGEAYQIEGRKRRPSVKRLDELHAESMKQGNREEVIAWLLKRAARRRGRPK